MSDDILEEVGETITQGYTFSQIHSLFRSAIIEAGGRDKQVKLKHFRVA